MKQKIIEIGNSKGIRIPSAFLKEVGLSKEANIQIQEDENHVKQIVIKPFKNPREGWEDLFSQPQEPLIPDAITSDWEKTEWEW